ncbi:MAG: pilus assembly PilX N-terminal domain-containing protein [Parcubacteria group bacterium]
MSSANFKKNKIKKGSALAYGLVIMFCVSIIVTSMLGYITSQLKFSFNRAEREEAFQIAEAGVYYYRWYLAHETSGKTAQQIQTFWETGNPLGVGSIYESDYMGLGKYQIEVVAPSAGSTIVTVKSTGWTYKEPNMLRIVQVRFRRPSWSEYAVLANDFMRFGEGTEVYGKIHSNKGIRFDGVAHNVISSLVSTFDDPDHSGGSEFGVHTHVNAPPASGVNDTFRSAEAPPSSLPSRPDVFMAGRQFPVPEVSFTGVVSDLSFMKTQAQSGGGKYFDSSGQGRQLILKTDGSYDIYTVNSYDAVSNYVTGYAGTKNSNGTGTACTAPITTIGPNTQCKNKTTGSTCYCKRDNYAIPNNGVIFVESNIWLEGTINKNKVTIVAANLIGGGESNIFIGNNNILYTNLDGADILGVIAQNDVEVIRNSQNNLVIDGAFIAKDGRVGRENYGMSDYKSSITMNGSMATNRRYGFSWTNGTISWGYETRNLNFDNNLLYYPPPYFPTGTEYAIDLWQEL